MTSLLHNGALSCIISVGFSYSGSWLLCREEGAKLSRSHHSRDQFGEGGQQEGTGNCKFLESLENEKVVSHLLVHVFIWHKSSIGNKSFVCVCVCVLVLLRPRHDTLTV